MRSGRCGALRRAPVGAAAARGCGTDRDVEAEFIAGWTSDDDPRGRELRVDLGGTDLLDTIRRRHCTTTAFETATNVGFEHTEVGDGVVVTDLVIEPTGSGTDRPVRIPLTFVVNRCDPHALAEVTNRGDLETIVGRCSASTANG